MAGVRVWRLTWHPKRDSGHSQDHICLLGLIAGLERGDAMELVPLQIKLVWRNLVIDGEQKRRKFACLCAFGSEVTEDIRAGRT